MIYVFDSSTLIKIFSNIYPERFPSFWKKFYKYIADGKIVSVRAVRTELIRRDDPLSDFAKQYNIFTTPLDDETSFVATIFQNHHFQLLIDKRARLGDKEVADPYLIAKAKINNMCVVTEEKLKPNAAKIPNVCEKFDVLYVNLEGFMEKEGWSF